jgi:hypothetical protein
MTDAELDSEHALLRREFADLEKRVREPSWRPEQGTATTARTEAHPTYPVSMESLRCPARLALRQSLTMR